MSSSFFAWHFILHFIVIKLPHAKMRTADLWVIGNGYSANCAAALIDLLMVICWSDWSPDLQITFKIREVLIDNLAIKLRFNWKSVVLPSDNNCTADSKHSLIWKDEKGTESSHSKSNNYQFVFILGWIFSVLWAFWLFVWISTVEIFLFWTPRSLRLLSVELTWKIKILSLVV